LLKHPYKINNLYEREYYAASEKDPHGARWFI
jgi:hypothetical protein